MTVAVYRRYTLLWVMAGGHLPLLDFWIKIKIEKKKELYQILTPTIISI
jgi:hypothetical protein